MQNIVTLGQINDALKITSVTAAQLAEMGFAALENKPICEALPPEESRRLRNAKLYQADSIVQIRVALAKRLAAPASCLHQIQEPPTKTEALAHYSQQAILAMGQAAHAAVAAAAPVVLPEPDRIAANLMRFVGLDKDTARKCQEVMRCALLAGVSAPAALAVEMPEFDLRTSQGGRGFVAWYFANVLGRHDFAKYISTTLAADFACALAQALHAPQAQADARDAELAKITQAYKELSGMFHDQIVAQQSAWIEWQHGNGAEAGMSWIENGLCGPGHIPDEEAPYGTDAQAWFDANKSNPFPNCPCGRPSNILWMGFGFCSNEHYDKHRDDIAAQAAQQTQGGEHV